MFLTCISIAVFFGLQLPINISAGITCHNSDIAMVQLESYYTWYYRLINFFIRSRICVLREDDRRRICAEVVKSCLPEELRQVTIEEIEDEIEYVGKCHRRDFLVPLPEGGFHKSRKRMFRCGTLTISGQKVNGFYVSAAGKPGAVLIFTRIGKTVRTSYLTVSYLVRGLMYHLWPFQLRPTYFLPRMDAPLPTSQN